MIAANYRQHPEAMALQLVLKFGHALVWALPRPSSRVLRAIRAARAATFKAAGRIAYPVRKTTPAWFKDAARKARKLAQLVIKAQRPLGFLEPVKRNAFAQRCADMREQNDRYTFG